MLIRSCWQTVACLLVVAVSSLSAGADQPAAPTDDTIEKAIKEHLQEDELLRNTNIGVSVSNGVATLDGSVATLYEQGRAARLASTLKGVRAVVNTTTISGQLRPEAELTVDVAEALAADPATASFDIDVKAAAGTVTLTGMVDSYAGKVLAGQVAKDVRGVQRLNNDLKVQPTVQRSDEEIDAEITRRLEADVWVDQRLIRVFVEDGHVTLRGVTGTLAETHAAELDAWVEGVKSVDVSDVKVDWLALDTERKKSKFTVRANYQIKDALADAFRYDPRVNRYSIDIDVRGGMVVLAGKVHNLAAKRAAEQDALNTVGVSNVENQLQVMLPRQRQNKELADDLRAALKRDAYLADVEVDVSVVDGRAVLSGKVDTAFSKRRAEQVAAHVQGLVEIDNRLEVAEPPRIVSDLQIKYSIKNRMYWSGYLESEAVSVNVENGEVTLTGEVDNRTAFDAAARMALEAGATKVHNRLKVREIVARP